MAVGPEEAAAAGAAAAEAAEEETGFIAVGAEDIIILYILW
jgi:hypothetical protein